MEELKSSDSSYDTEEFCDADDDFPFYDCCSEPFDSVVETVMIDDDAAKSKSWSEDPSSPGLRRRRSLSRRLSGDESATSGSSGSFKRCSSLEEKNTGFSLRTTEKGAENEKKNQNLGNPGSLEVNPCSVRENDATEEEKETSTITDENDGAIDAGAVYLTSRENTDASTSLLFLLVHVIVKVISFQINLFVSLFFFPIRFIYHAYMFVIDPFGVTRRGRMFLFGKLMSIWRYAYHSVSPFMHEWFKEHKGLLKLVLKFGWGLLWSSYVCGVLVAVLVSAFVVGGFVSRLLVEEPIRIKEDLNFDFTEKSPIAFVPLTGCPSVDCDAECLEKIQTGKLSGTRVIPSNHKLQVTISLILPESNYNRNLGIFQVKINFLSPDGRILSSSRQPCMLQYKSLPIRLLSTFLKVFPLVTGYTSETQRLDITFKGFTEGYPPTACLKVILEQRAEFQSGGGVPQIYAASLTIESELPVLRRLIWFWRKTLFVWVSMTMFTLELFFILVCCKSMILPRVKLRGNQANVDASQTNLVET